MQALVAALAAACLAFAPGASSSRLLVITQADSGKTFRLVAGSRAELHLSGKWVWSTPVVRGRGVDLVQINYFKDPGYSGWSIESKGPGLARIVSKGSPSCKPCPRKARRFAVTIVVRRRA